MREGADWIGHRAPEIRFAVTALILPRSRTISPIVQQRPTGSKYFSPLFTCLFFRFCFSFDFLLFPQTTTSSTGQPQRAPRHPRWNSRPVGRQHFLLARASGAQTAGWPCPARPWGRDLNASAREIYGRALSVGLPLPGSAPPRPAEAPARVRSGGGFKDHCGGTN